MSLNVRCLGMAETPVLAAGTRTSRVFFFIPLYSYVFSFLFFIFFLQNNIRRIRRERVAAGR
jgi:hypothetical protein